MQILFTGECLLCLQVFVWNQSSREECFAAITENNLAMLLSFGEAIIMSKRSPEILFILLDMYGIMCELQTEVTNLLGPYSFHRPNSAFVRKNDDNASMDAENTVNICLLLT